MELFKFKVLIFILFETRADEWSYHDGIHGPSNWGGLCNSGTRQSPININVDNSGTTIDLTLREFNFTNYNTSNKYFMVKNEGHTIKVEMNSHDVTISGGGLADADYILVQFHFHWGLTSAAGSEHTLNGLGSPLEVHFVHFNNAYGNISHAVSQPNGLAVLGFMFNVQSSDNTAIDFLINALVAVTNKGQTHHLSSTPPIDTLLGNVDRRKYLRYHGSLTTPKCYESVQWTIFTETIPISEAQLNKMRAMKSDTTGSTSIGFNYRPVQRVYSRRISISYDPGVSAATIVYQNIATCVISISFLLFK